jgi:hypothetical protein
MQTQPHSVLEAFQREIHEALRQISHFRDLPIHIDSRSWFEAQIRCQAEMTSGIHIRIHPPIPRHIEKGIAGPIFNDLELCIEILEYPISNTSSWSAIAIAETICRQLHGLSLTPPTWQGQLVCRTEKAWSYAFEDTPNCIQLYFTATCSF